MLGRGWSVNRARGPAGILSLSEAKPWTEPSFRPERDAQARKEKEQGPGGKN